MPMTSHRAAAVCPIVLAGTGMIGSVCVSGEPNHLDDQEIVVKALRQLKAEKNG